jgi:Spy/CpxP family protein refolding chaperone
MKKRIFIIAFLALATAATSAFSQAKTEKKIIKHVTDSKAAPAPQRPCGLDLTDEQRKKVDAMDLETEKALLPLRGQIDVRNAELKQLMLADKPDAAAVEKKIDEIGALRTQIEKKRVLQQLAVRGLLTPEQRVDFDRNLLSRRHGMGFGLTEPEGRDFLMHRGGEGPMKRMLMQKRFPGCPEGPCGEPGEEVEIEIETK